MLYEVTTAGSHVHDNSTTNEDPGQTSASMKKLKGESPWGTYVTTKEALKWIEWNQLKRQNSQCDNRTFDEHLAVWRQEGAQFYEWQNNLSVTSDEKKEEHMLCTGNVRSFVNNMDDLDFVRHVLAVEAVARFFLETIPLDAGATEVVKASADQLSSDALFQKEQFIKEAHGVAVWALSSNSGNSVSYHIDYAELFRYEYNITVPPFKLWNGESKTNDNLSKQNHMRGGEFCVNLRGLEHYAEHGYKGNLSGDPMGGWRRPDAAEGSPHHAGGAHIDDANQWVTIPYAFNRGIAHHGELPHLSAPIETIGPSNVSRVIVGFNVFGHDVGMQVSKAPEHSKAFRRKVRLYRSTIASTRKSKGAGRKSTQDGMDLNQIRQNKGLTKLLVLAKREKVKSELRRNQEQLSLRIWNCILSQHSRGGPLLQVADIVKEFGCANDDLDVAWPNSSDVHVHLHHLVATKSPKATAKRLSTPFQNHFQDKDGVVGPA
ncbi:hypothetical protein ACHAWF_011441 [Thalassiosira exigua]